MSQAFEAAISARVEQAVATGEADQILDKLEKFTETPQTVEDITDFLHTIDGALMQSFRKFWNKLPLELQWFLMHTTKGPNLVSGTGPLQILMKFGFINYKGHHNHENDLVMDEQIERMGGLERLALKYGVSFGKYFSPELKAIQPYLKYVFRLNGIANNLLAKVRRNLRNLREAAEAPAKNIKKIRRKIRQATKPFHQ